MELTTYMYTTMCMVWIPILDGRISSIQIQQLLLGFSLLSMSVVIAVSWWCGYTFVLLLCISRPYLNAVSSVSSFRLGFVSTTFNIILMFCRFPRFSVQQSLLVPFPSGCSLCRDWLYLLSFSFQSLTSAFSGTRSFGFDFQWYRYYFGLEYALIPIIFIAFSTAFDWNRLSIRIFVAFSECLGSYTSSLHGVQNHKTYFSVSPCISDTTNRQQPIMCNWNTS